jgi:hypothetical protein
MSKERDGQPYDAQRRAPAFLHAPAQVCPRCTAPCEGPSLLTSMTRYYTCDRCATRWQVARDWQIVQERI